MQSSYSSTTIQNNLKVVLLGEGCVGKTSIVLRFIEDKFNSNHISTLQASFLTKKINLNDEIVKLNIWDTAGQERFHALGPIYYRSSNGAILVYDITDQDSFHKVKSWVKELKKMLGAKIVIAIVGNKTDLEKYRNVNQDDAENYARIVGATYFETSAKSNKGIKELFLGITSLMINSFDQKEAIIHSSPKHTNLVGRSNKLVIDENDYNIERAATLNSSCCGAG